MDQSASVPWTDPTRSEHIDQLVDALAKAQAQIKAPERNRTVEVIPRSGGRGYKFKYATLDHIIEICRKPLTDNGLWPTQIIKMDSSGMYVLDTRLMHASGQWIACQTPLIVENPNSNQSFGSALTFMRRYAWTTLLGIAAEEDDDANIADGNQVQSVQDKLKIEPDVMQNLPLVDDKLGIKPPFQIPVLEDDPDSGYTVDWRAFGESLMTYIRACGNSNAAQQWRSINDPALRRMEKEAPKAYTNLSLSILRTINEFERKERTVEKL